MKVIILAGGRGTRLPESAKDIPKALVPIKGKAMLDHLFDGLFKHGLRDIRLSLGFKADQIVAHLEKSGYKNVEYVIEQEPLGTGGAVKFAAGDLSDDFMVLNGDIIHDIDFTALLKHHMLGKPCVVAAWRKDARDFGLLDIKEDKILAFREKPETPQSGYINAGCYILHPKHLEGIVEKSFMLEKDVFPRLAGNGELRTFIHRGFWQDAGTEERLTEVRDSASLFEINFQ